ncbi:TlpA family protein disulfide reductase [Leeia sp.]|uniref:TlpA family protein disulfide reductase n=1 Tax=Leeia sp. TaxID=2884678 RepID=UPI0035AE4935
MQASRRQWLWGIGVGLVAAGAGFGLRLWQTSPHAAAASAASAPPPSPTPAAGPGQQLWQRRWPDLQGVVQPLSQWRGKVLVVNFWATWCAPCREEIPAFVRIQSDFALQGVQFVGIALDQADLVESFAHELNINYPLLLTGEEGLKLLPELGNPTGGLPFTLVYDTDGRLLHTHLGPIAEDVLRQVLEPLLPRP